MRIAAVALLVALVLSSITAQVVYGQEPNPTAPPERVSVAVTTASARDTPHTRANTLLLWNRNVRTTPIGHGVESCIKVGYGGLLGDGILSCDLTLALPLGKLTATGIIHGFRRYTIVITGGTGAYVKAHGPLFVRSVTGDGVRRLTFSVG